MEAPLLPIPEDVSPEDSTGSGLPPETRPAHLDELPDVPQAQPLPLKNLKQKKMIRNARRIVLRKPVLTILLGRQLARQTKPILKIMAQQVDEVPVPFDLKQHESAAEMLPNLGSQPAMAPIPKVPIVA